VGYKGAMNANDTDSLASLWKGDSQALLKALHILTRDGKLNADSRRKLKQVYHLTQLIEPLLLSQLTQTEKVISKSAALKNAPENFTVVDMGAGKSYLGFILYDLILKKHLNTEVISIESRTELVERSEKLAAESGFDRMKFVGATIEESMESPKIPSTVGMVCALHACDTATDDAIRFGILHHASSFALVPCCQAEIAAQLKPQHQNPSANALHDFPLHRREFGSHLTNVLRTLYLMSQGYKVTVTELVGWEHSMKNELILAEKISTPEHPKSLEALQKWKELSDLYRVKLTHLAH
jgi:hypothetical protein